MLFLLADKNKKVEKWPLTDGEVRALFPNVSFPEDLTSANLSSFNIFPVEATVIPKPTKVLHRVALGVPEWDGVRFVRTYVEEPIPEDLVAKRMKNIRQYRDRLLGASDWTQLADTNLSKPQKTAWKEYRQKLRDITSTIQDPFNFDWPTKPE